MAKEIFHVVRFVYAGCPLYHLITPSENYNDFVKSLPKDKVSYWSVHELVEQSPKKTSEDNRLPTTNIVITYDSGATVIRNGYSPDNIQKALKDLNFKDVSEIKIRIL